MLRPASPQVYCGGMAKAVTSNHSCGEGFASEGLCTTFGRSTPKLPPELPVLPISGIAPGVLRWNGKSGDVEPFLRGRVRQRGFMYNVRTVDAKAAAGIAGVAIVRREHGCEWLAGLSGNNSAELKSARPACRAGDLIDQCDGRPVGHVVTRKTSLEPVIVAILRKVLIRRGGQEGRSIVDGFRNCVSCQHRKTARHAAVERHLQRLVLGVPAALGHEDVAVSRIG